MLRCGSFIGLSSAISLQVLGETRLEGACPLSGIGHTFESCRVCRKSAGRDAGIVAALPIARQPPTTGIYGSLAPVVLNERGRPGKSERLQELVKRGSKPRYR
jgi:hypothetical protein